MTRKNRAVIFALTLAAGVLAGATLAQDVPGDNELPLEPDEMTFEWTAPTTGSPAVKYEVQIRKRGTEITNREVTTNQITFPVEWLTLYEVRVRGVNAADEVGPWSIWSRAEDRDHIDPNLGN